MQGIILTANSFDRKEQLHICLGVKTEEGVFELLYKERALFFIETVDLSKIIPLLNEQGIDFSHKELTLKTFGGEYVTAIYFTKLSDFHKAVDYLAKNKIRTFESDIRPHDRFLMERFIGAFFDYTGKIEDIPPLKGATLPLKFLLKGVSLDIETGQNGQLYAVALTFFTPLQKGFNHQLRAVLSDKEDQADGVNYFSHEHLLFKFLEESITNEDPDFIIGWHVVGFDLLFLQKRAEQLKIPFSLSRFSQKMNIVDKGNVAFANIAGRVVLDGIHVLKSNQYTFDNFKLETVAQAVLKKGKSISSTISTNKVAEIERLFREDKKALSDYNLLDTELVLEIFEKLSLLELLLHRSEISSLLLDKSASIYHAFDHFMLPRIHRRGFVAPNIKEQAREGEGVEQQSGGLVFPPSEGLSQNIAVLDFKSLYPSIIKTFGIDPYSRLIASAEDNKRVSLVKTPSGHLFCKDEALLPAQMELLLKKREKAQLGAIAKAIKLQMNSYYGVMSSPHCRFYHADLQAAITMTGQWLLTKSAEFLTNQGFEIVYGDTDSLFVKVKDKTPRDATLFAHSLCERVNDYLKRILFELYGVDSELQIRFDRFYTQIYFAPLKNSKEGAAKKRYAAMCFNNENFEEELIFKGMEFVRSDTPLFVKDFQYELYKKFFLAKRFEELEEWIKDLLSRLKSGLFDERLFITKGLSKNLDDYEKTKPPHIKAAQMLIDAKLELSDKISYLMTTKGVLPRELWLLNPHSVAIDYDYYMAKQLAPIADGILCFYQKDFSSLMSDTQLSLF